MGNIDNRGNNTCLWNKSKTTSMIPNLTQKYKMIIITCRIRDNYVTPLKCDMTALNSEKEK